MADNSSPSKEEFDLGNILHTATVRHNSVVAADGTMIPITSEFTRAMDDVLYQETNIRGWATGRESQERNVLEKLWRKSWKQILADYVSQLEYRESVRRSVFVDLEASERLKLASIGKKLKKHVIAGAHGATADMLAVSGNTTGSSPTVRSPSRSPAPEDDRHRPLARLDSCNTVTRDVITEAMRCLLISEANVRHTVTMGEQRDRNALKDIHDDLVDDLEEAATSGGVAYDGSRVYQPQHEVRTAAEDVSRLFVMESNVRYTIFMAEYKARAAIEELSEALEAAEEISVQRKLDFHQSNATPNGIQYDARGVSDSSHHQPAAPYPRHLHFPQDESPMNVMDEMGAQLSSPSKAVQSTAAPIRQKLTAAFGGDFLIEDEEADRRNVIEEWGGELSLLYDAMRSYIAYEYDWVLGGPRQVVRADGDMFKKQNHLPGGYRRPQKQLVHERLCILDRFMLEQKEEEQRVQQHPNLLVKGVAQVDPAPPSTSVPNSIMMLRNASKISNSPPARKGTSPNRGDTDCGNAMYSSSKYAQDVSPFPHHQLKSPQPPSGAGSSKKKQPPPPLKAKNDSLLQSLLYQELTARTLMEKDFALMLQRARRESDADLKMEFNWAYAATTPNVYRIQRPASHRERHLPDYLRIEKDPKQAPALSPRPPSEYFITPQKSSKAEEHLTTVGAHTCTATGAGRGDSALPLRLPIPPQFAERAKSARSAPVGVKAIQ